MRRGRSEKVNGFIVDIFLKNKAWEIQYVLPLPDRRRRDHSGSLPACDYENNQENGHVFRRVCR
jgi:hypothetical protein